MCAKEKIRWGDRRDGIWLRDIDPMHGFMPYLMPNRADNEAFVREKIDLTALEKYLAEKTKTDPDFKYTYFHAILAALVKTVVLRPDMNRFISGNRLYMRRNITAAFTVKKRFADEAHEALAFLKFERDSTIDSVHAQLRREIIQLKKPENTDNSTDAMAMLMKLPRPVIRIVMAVLRRLDYHGRVPYGLVKTDPNYATIFLSNLGSIKLNAAYHHLNNWGTNSFFVVIGEKSLQPFHDENGNVEMRPALEIGMTLDERIADGYYYSKSIRLFKHLLQHPELLDTPAHEEVDY